MEALKRLLTTPAANLGRIGRFVAFQYRLWRHCFRLLKKNRAEPLAAALSYYTIFGIIPLAIVVVLIFHSLPAYRQTGEQLKRLAYQELNLTRIEYPDPEDPGRRIALTDYLDQIIDKFFANLDKESLGLISAVLVIWAALRLLGIVEGAFNHMWHVPRGRSFIHRVINYWALLTLVPLLLGVGLYVTTKYAILKHIETSTATAISPLISYLVSALALFLLYLVMPNAKVRAGAALWGALVGALAWSLARWGFGVYVTQIIPYSAIYGVLGLIPLVVFWVYVAWLVVLLGLQLTFVIQHLDKLEAAEVPKAREAGDRFIANDITAIAAVREIALAFENNRAPISVDDVCSSLDLPGEFGERLLEEMVLKGVLARTSEPRAGFVLARDPEHIRLSDIAGAVATASFAQPKPDQPGNLHQILQAEHRLLADYSLKDVLDAARPRAEGTSQEHETTPEQVEPGPPRVPDSSIP